MKRYRWKAWLALVASGSVMFQAPTCAETAAVVTSVATVATAGGVIYLVTQVIND